MYVDIDGGGYLKQCAKMFSDWLVCISVSRW